MSNEHKYVRFPEPKGFVLWLKNEPYHDDVARLFKVRPISAGFVRFEDGRPYCYGTSMSLGLSARAELLARQLA